MNNKYAFILTHESNPQRTSKATSFIALALTRSLGRRRVPVIRIHPNRLDRSLSSRYCSRVEISPDFYDSEERLLSFLLGLEGKYRGSRVLFPASDDCAYFVTKYRDPLSQVFEIVAPTRQVAELILDKKSQYRRAQELSLPIPETHFPLDRADVLQLASELRHYPYVIKPLVAHSWRLAAMQKVSEGKKGFAVHSPGELVERYDQIAEGDKNLMIQEVIGGSDQRLFTFLSYLDAASRPLGYCIRKKVRQLPIDFGYCTMTVSCHEPVVERQSLRLLQGLGYHGISGVEWKLDERTGTYKLIEINPRAVNTIAIAAACGVDLPYLAFLDKTEGDCHAVTEWQDGVRWLDLEQDFWAGRELRRAGRLTSGEWWRSIGGPGVEAVFARDDPLPFAGHAFGILSAQCRRLFESYGRQRSVNVALKES